MKAYLGKNLPRSCPSPLLKWCAGPQGEGARPHGELIGNEEIGSNGVAGSLVPYKKTFLNSLKLFLVNLRRSAEVNPLSPPVLRGVVELRLKQQRSPGPSPFHAVFDCGCAVE